MALTALSFAVKRAPQDTQLRLLLAREYRMMGKDGEALREVEEGLRVDASDPLVVNERGVLLYALKRYTDAETTFVAVLRLIEGLSVVDVERCSEE